MEKTYVNQDGTFTLNASLDTKMVSKLEKNTPPIKNLLIFYPYIYLLIR